MTLPLLIPAVLSLLVLAAHFLRGGNLVLTAMCLLMLPLLLIRRQWIAWLVQSVLIVGAAEWLFTANTVVQMRIHAGRDWQRPALILIAVAAVTLLSAMLFFTRRLRSIYA